MDISDYQFWKVGFDILQSIILALLWFTTKHSGLQHQVRTNDEKIAKLEERINAFPRAKDIGELKGKVDHMNTTLNRISTYLLSEK